MNGTHWNLCEMLCDNADTIDYNTYHLLRYPGGRLIALTKRPHLQEMDRQYDHEVLVCADCRMKR
jgi:hypothetical protein